MGTSRRSRRQGKTLTEQLIAFAIAASMLGIALPIVSGQVHEARVARARQDLSVLIGAIRRWESGNSSLLTGGNLRPLLGGTLSSLPTDPWGNDYFFDGSVGVIGTFATDGVQGGTDQDADIFMLIREEISTVQALLAPGRFGFLQKGDRCFIQLSKPVSIDTSSEDPADDFDLLLPTEGAAPVSLSFLGFIYDSANSRPSEGRIVFSLDEDPPPGRRVVVSEGSQISIASFPMTLNEITLPSNISGLERPDAFMRGSESSVRADGSWSGAVVRLL